MSATKSRDIIGFMICLSLRFLVLMHHSELLAEFHCFLNKPLGSKVPGVFTKFMNTLSARFPQASYY